MDDVYIHPSSIVDPGAQIGAGTKIWHFCHIMHGVQMGQNCSVGQNVFIASGVVLGNRVKIQNNVSVYAGVICEDDVFLGPSCVFTNVNNPRSHVVRKSEYKPTLLKKGVTIGANATILCGITIGAYAFIGAGTVVLHDVPDYALMVGNPAKQIGWMSRDGYRLYFLKNIAFCAEENAYYKIENNQVRYLGNQNI